MVGWILHSHLPVAQHVVGRSRPAQKLEYVAAYEAAVAQGNGGAYLRQEGLYSSQITEWRTLYGTTKTMFVPARRSLRACP
jgi:hypothetical protein